MAKKNSKKASLGWFFWVAFILLVGLLFFINKENIKSVLEKTNAKTVFQKKESETEAPREPDLMQIQEEIEKITAYEEEKEAEQKAAAKQRRLKEQRYAETKPPFPEKNELKTPAVSVQEKNELALQTETEQITTEKESFDEKPAEAGVRKAVLFFTNVENDGRIIKKAVDRELVKSTAPMKTALKALFKGPTAQEAKNGIRSFIPPETRLLSAYVKNGIAVINLSEEFQFNRYGIEAYQAQLAQIVFTVCEFPTVDAVQFLIDGEKKQYLGGEGVWIGSPLSIGSF